MGHYDRLPRLHLFTCVLLEHWLVHAYLQEWLSVTGIGTHMTRQPRDCCASGDRKMSGYEGV